MVTKQEDKTIKSQNPGDTHADKLFPDDGVYVSSGLDQLEALANDSNSTGRYADDTESVREQEESAESTHNIIDNFTGHSQGRGAFKGKMQKGGPIALLLAAMIAIAGVVGFFGGPSMLILDIAEKMTDKFNYQLTSMDTRTNKIMNAKFKNTTTGCSKLSPAICKYSTLSEKTVKNIDDLKKRGVDINLEIEVAAQDGRFSSKRYAIKDIKWQGGSIKASDFAKFSRANPEFANAMRRIYNPKFVGLSDGVSLKVRSLLKILKKAPFEPNTTNEEKQRTVVETTREGRTSLTTRVTNGDLDPNCTQKCNELAPDQNAKVGGVIDEINNLANEADSGGIKQTTKAFGNIARDGIGKIASTVGALGIMDDGCTVYGMFKAVGTGIKLIRNNQAARFAMIFLTTASMIRASIDASANDDLSPEVTTFVGDILTTTFTNSDGTTTKSATDSFGYRYAASFGDTAVDENASQYIAGAGLGGSMSGVMGLVINLLGGSIEAADQTCKIVNNPAVQIGSFAAGVALLLIPGGPAVSIGKLAGQAAFGAATVAAQMILPSILADIIAGKLVDDKTVGESAGNIITVGAGHMLGLTSLKGGNAILKPSQARNVRAQQVEVLAKYAEDDRRNYSPLDPTNKNTFMGNIRSQLTPLLNSSSSTNLAAISSSLFGSITKLMPSAGAAPQETYKECQDTEYRIIDLATDPLCNPIYGIPSEYIDKEPIAIFESLKSRGFIDDNGTPQQPYLDFIGTCIDRTISFGSTGDDSQTSRGEECFIENQDKADQYIYLIDQRVQVTMDGDDPVLEGKGVLANISTSGAIGSVEPNARAAENWGGFKNGVIDQSALHDISTPPDAESMLAIKSFLSTKLGSQVSDSDITTTFKGCDVPAYDANGKPKVGSKPFMHPKAFVSFVALNAAYKIKFNKDIQLISCYRDLEGQKSAKEYWTQQGSPGNAADPGTSNHGWGLALDLGPGSTGSGFRYGTPEYIWMMANAPQFGWINPKNMQQGQSGPHEPWHWEYARSV